MMIIIIIILSTRSPGEYEMQTHYDRDNNNHNSNNNRNAWCDRMGFYWRRDENFRAVRRRRRGQSAPRKVFRTCRRKRRRVFGRQLH